MHDYDSRLERFARSLDSLQVDAFLVSEESNVHYLTGFTGDSSVLLVTPQSTAILSDGRYDTQIAKECPKLTALIRPPGQPLHDLMRQAISDSSIKRLGFESDHVSVATFRFLQKACQGIEWIETRGAVERQRIVKDDSEIALIRRAVDVAQRSFQSWLPMMTTDWTERQIAHELESNMRLLGASGCSFPIIVAFGDASALPHYLPSHRQIDEDQVLLIDWGAKFDGYASDLTRTLHTDDVSDDFRRAYDAVLQAQLSAIDAIGPGAVARDVDAAARGVLKKLGLDEAFIHGLGHGFGLKIHEAPRLSYESDDVLEPGMVVTVEPGVYFRDAFGIRIEDDILVTEAGAEVLSNLPKGLADCRLIL